MLTLYGFQINNIAEWEEKKPLSFKFMNVTQMQLFGKKKYTWYKLHLEDPCRYKDSNYSTSTESFSWLCKRATAVNQS